MDCGFSIVRDGEQHAFHASRRMPIERTETQVGPFRIEILEPMRSIRVVLDENETGISCDLHFLARTACVEEGRQTTHRGKRVAMDATRFAQFGRWKGRVRYAGQTLDIDPSRVYATKDRSWGMRPVGEPELGGAPSSTPPQFFFLWAPLHWKDRCSHFAIFEDGSGVPWAQDGMFVPSYASPDEIPGTVDPGVVPMGRVEHEITYAKGTRRAEHAQIALIERSGTRHEIELEPLLRFQMKGIGYTHPEWGHGRWKGELAIGGESWKVDEVDDLELSNQHIQQVVRARSGDEEGIGVLEQIHLGPHKRYGFKDFLGPAT
jgi:hypothetical protein